MLDPRITQAYQDIINRGQLNLLRTAFVIMHKQEWKALPKNTLKIYEQAKVQPILFDDFAELPGLVEQLKHYVTDETMSAKTNIIEQNQRIREQREQNIIEELLIEELAPQIVTVIANIWLNAKPADGYEQHIKNKLNARTSRKVAHTFGKIIDPIADLCELLPPHDMGFEDKRNLFNQLTELFKQTAIDSDLFEKAKRRIEILQGSFIAIDKQATNKAIEETYQKALFNLSELLIDGIGALPSWNDDNLTALVSDKHDLFDKFNESLTQLAESLSQVENQTDEIASTFRREVIRRFNQLRIFGINFNSVSRYQLEVAYISLSLENENSSQELTTEQALTGFERLVILGDAGQGKTTLLQWLTVKCAQQAFNDEGENSKSEWNQKVPILIKLREVLKNDELPKVDEFFALMDNSKPVTDESQAWLTNAVAAKQAIFMVDGFDEVPLERRPDTLSWLKDLCEQYTGNHFILTSRPGAYDEGTDMAQ